jgi:hypothetical protein
MALARAITRIIPRPCAPTRGNQGLARMAAASTRPCVGIPPGAAWRPVVGHAGVVGLPLRVGTAPPARLARVARDEAEAWRPSVGLGAVPCALMGGVARWGREAGCVCSAACWDNAAAAQAVSRIRGVGPGACTSVGRRCRRVWSGVRDRPSARAQAAAVPGSPVVAASWRRPAPAAASSRRHRPDHGRRASRPAHGTSVAPCVCRAGRAERRGGGAAPATAEQRDRRVMPSWERRSSAHSTTACTVATHEPFSFGI